MRCIDGSPWWQSDLTSDMKGILHLWKSTWGWGCFHQANISTLGLGLGVSKDLDGLSHEVGMCLCCPWVYVS